jgi:nucleotide-binding universal stress UspA family protein
VLARRSATARKREGRLRGNNGFFLSSSPQGVAGAPTGEFLREIAEPFQNGPYEVNLEWKCGDPPLAILESAKQKDVQMIVVGARGLKGIKRFLLGSVSQKVLEHAPCSVLIVRRQDK